MPTIVAKVVSSIVFLVILSVLGCVPTKRRLPSVLAEASGLYISNDTLRIINDGGNAAKLYTLSDNNLLAALDINFPNTDWEGLTSFSDGTLCICDIGDNRRQRDSIQFIFVDNDIQRRVARAYPDGAHNAESCFVKNDELFVLTKARAGIRPREKLARLYKVDTASLGESKLTIIDSIALLGKVATDAVYDQEKQLLHILSYNYDFALGMFPFSRTSVWTVGLPSSGGFRQNSLQERKVRAPFTLTQYEAIGIKADGSLLILSEKTTTIKPRLRRLKP